MAFLEKKDIPPTNNLASSTLNFAATAGTMAHHSSKELLQA
jgi:uncharacterized protein involved in propanediol utilization